VERLQDVPNRIQEVALHGVRSGAANALAVAQLRHGVQLLKSLTPNFIEEGNDEGIEELVEEFAPCADAVTQISSVEDIIARAFGDED